MLNYNFEVSTDFVLNIKFIIRVLHIWLIEKYGITREISLKFLKYLNITLNVTKKIPLIEAVIGSRSTYYLISCVQILSSFLYFPLKFTFEHGFYI